MGALKVALAQINPTVGDFEGNAGIIVDIAAKARAAQAALVVFPELALCGYPPEDLLLRRGFLRDSRLALEKVAARSLGIAAVVGFPDFDGEKVYNGAALLEGGEVRQVYHKRELPNYGVFDEKRYFSPGEKSLFLPLGGLPASVTVCEDLWVEGNDVEEDAREEKPSLVINISASPFHAGKLEERRTVLAGFAKRTGTTVCYVNLVGGQDELVFDGGSLVIDSTGRTLAAARRFEEDLLVVDIDVDVEGSETRELSPPPEPDRLSEVYQALVLGTADYVGKNGFEKVVIGVSGGIDSALTLAVAVDALGSDRVTAVTMPSRFSSVETQTDAALVAENLDVSLLTIPVEEVLAAYMGELSGHFGPGDPGVAAENLQARIRGNYLMALSNRFGWIVLTTGNKSETAVGYCTLYGDMAGGFAVIKDVPKTLVYELSRHVNGKAGREIIPVSTLERAPTAELRDDQKDEDSLPPYGVLDPILKGYVEDDLAPEEIAASGYDHSLVEEVVRMVDRNEYKRRQAPPGIKITPKAFGRDRRLPLTNRYRAGRGISPPKKTL